MISMIVLINLFILLFILLFIYFIININDYYYHRHLNNSNWNNNYNDIEANYINNLLKILKIEMKGNSSVKSLLSIKEIIDIKRYINNELRKINKNNDNYQEFIEIKNFLRNH
jgi:hypothetical protein